MGRRSAFFWIWLVQLVAGVYLACVSCGYRPRSMEIHSLFARWARPFSHVAEAPIESPTDVLLLARAVPTTSARSPWSLIGEMVNPHFMSPMWCDPMPVERIPLALLVAAPVLAPAILGLAMVTCAALSLRAPRRFLSRRFPALRRRQEKAFALLLAWWTAGVCLCGLLQVSCPVAADNARPPSSAEVLAWSLVFAGLLAAVLGAGTLEWLRRGTSRAASPARRALLTVAVAVTLSLLWFGWSVRHDVLAYGSPASYWNTWYSAWPRRTWSSLLYDGAGQLLLAGWGILFARRLWPARKRAVIHRPPEPARARE
jgi:hypothetical protein